jgi:Tfp pilus assembly protein PilO
MNSGLRIVTCAALCGGMMAAAWSLVFAPGNKRIAAIRVDRDEKVRQLADLHAHSADAKDWSQQIDKLQRAIGFLQNKLPEEKEMDKVLRDISQLSTDNGLTTRSWHPEKPIDGPSYSELSIKLQMSGSYSGFYKFVQGIEENVSRIIRISDLTLMKVDGQEGDVTADLTLTIFFDQEHRQLAEAE